MIPHDEYIKEISYNDFLASAEVIKRVCESCRNCIDCYYYGDKGCSIKAVIAPNDEYYEGPCNWNIPKSL